jgi:hypothetical protein
MNLVNATNLAAGYTMATDKTGREWLVVVAKGTYGIPDQSDREPRLLDEQVPPVMTDEFTGEPGFSAPRYEIDFAPRKPRCDVLLNGSAYAPGGKPTERVTVSLQVGSMVKSFDVVGNRVWKRGVAFTTPSDPEPFAVMPISYNNAFGGIDRSQDDPAKHRWYPSNHAGVGYHKYLDAAFIDGKPLPNTEETGRRVRDPRGKYRPMAFGPVGRAWLPRYELAGTYDQKWLDQQFPFLPADFDDHYFQCAPKDQQTEHLRGGELVTLLNLTPQGRMEFRLPELRPPFYFHYKNGDTVRVSGAVDTLVLEPDLGRFTLCVRAGLALHRSLHEVGGIDLGYVLPQPISREGDESETMAKTRYRSLAEMVEAYRARAPRS